MKKILIFFLVSTSLCAQKIETIKFSQSVKSKKHNYKTFEVIDQRTNPEIGSVTFHKNQVDIKFQNEATQDLQNWFYKDNPTRGEDDLVLLLEKINVSEEKLEKYSIGKLEVRASTFLKKEDGYYFLSRKDTVTTISSLKTPYLAQSIVKKLTLSISDLLKNSYRAKSWEFAISKEELPNYTALLKDKLEILTTENLKDGVYKDYYSFFTHNPEPGFTIEMNSKGKVKKAVKGTEEIPIRNLYAFVHKGIPYKVIPIGYVEIFRDELGLFIDVKRQDLYPEANSSIMVIGGGIGGLVGSLVGNLAIAAIDANKAKKRKDVGGTEVSLDPYTGNYILPENFNKSK